ncbi:MAG: chalcone isomerase family protein [Piscinibacter sp.]
MDTPRRLLLLGLALAPLGVRADTAPPAEVDGELAGARLLGSGRLTFLGLHIYDARLWAADGFAADSFERHPIALELIYGRTLYGRLIAERSLDEMKRIGGFSDEQGERWLASMKQTFPDVAKGDRITGVQRPQEAARFFLNGALRGELRDPEFTRRFFGIWLSPQTSEPKLRQSLLGPALPKP